jgi:hypothetical protein
LPPGVPLGEHAVRHRIIRNEIVIVIFLFPGIGTPFHGVTFDKVIIRIFVADSNPPQKLSL